MTAPRRGVVARGLLAAVGFYSRAISPALPPRCRFAPTCSAYAAEAIAVHGAGRGTWLALRRLLKCAPWHPGGHDPVPPRRGATPPGGAAAAADGPAPHHPATRGPAVHAAPDPDRHESTSSPAPRRSAQQEARVA
ncbi:membrane protein insertion efficiency factor YidD [Blastococcus sp. SYSU D00695]